MVVGFPCLSASNTMDASFLCIILKAAGIRQF
jgi:hypothetical protein